MKSVNKKIIDKTAANNALYRYLHQAVSKDIVTVFKLKCDFYGLHPSNVLALLATIFAQTDELDYYFNIPSSDSIFFKERINYYNNILKRR